MKVKIISVLSIVFIGLFSFCLPVFAEEGDLFEEQMKSSGAYDLFDVLNEEQKDLLSELEIDSLDFGSLFSVSPHKIFDLFFEVVTDNYQYPLKTAFTVGVMITAVAIASQFVLTNEKNMRIISFFSVLCVALCLIVPLSNCLTRVISAIGLTSDFMLALIPVLAAVLTVSGNPSAAFSYNSLCFVAAQSVVQLAENFIRPLIQIILSLSITSSLNTAMSFGKLIAFMKKITVFFISLLSTVFVTMLSLKGMLAAAADGVAVRGIRFMIGNIIPVVGGAVSDAYSSIIGTLTMVKNTVAVFAVVAVAVINMPTLTECVCWIFALNLLSALSDMLSQNIVSSLLNSVSSAVTLLTVSLLLVAIVFILSIGLIMVFKGG